jgi:hypothetical protein
MMRLDRPFPQIATGDLDIPIFGQLLPANLSLRDDFESGAVKVVGLEAPFRRGGSRSRIWNTRRETRTTPSYSPTPMPNSTTEQ